MAARIESEYIERTITINRVAKVIKGGRRFSFSALVVVGDGKGKIGVGHGKAREVPLAVSKATNKAKKAMFKVPIISGTVPHPVQGESTAAVVFLRPASNGTGVIAGGPVRAVMESVGYTDVLSKSLGSSNVINITYATIEALKLLQDPIKVAQRRGLPIERVLPPKLLKALKSDAQKDVVQDISDEQENKDDDKKLSSNSEYEEIVTVDEVSAPSNSLDEKGESKETSPSEAVDTVEEPVQDNNDSTDEGSADDK